MHVIMSYKERLKEALENISFQADTTWSLADTTLYQKCNLELYLTENHLQRSKFQRYRPRTVRECIPESKLAQYSNYGYNESREMSYATSIIAEGLMSMVPPPVVTPPIPSGSEPWEMGEVDELFAWFLKDLHEDNFSRVVEAASSSAGRSETHESPLLKVHGFEDRILKIRLTEDRVKNIWKQNVEDEMLPAKKTKDVLVNIYMSPLGNFFVTNNKRGDLANDGCATKDNSCDWFRNISISKDFDQLQQLSKALQEQKTWIVKSLVETIEATTQHHHVSVAPPTLLVEQKQAIATTTATTTTTTTTKTATEILYSEVLQGLLPSKKNKQAQQLHHQEKPPTPPPPVDLVSAKPATEETITPVPKTSDHGDTKKEPKMMFQQPATMQPCLSSSNHSHHNHHQRNQQHNNQQYYSNVAAKSQQYANPSPVENNSSSRSSYSSMRCFNSFQATSSATTSNASFQQTWRWRQQYQDAAAAAASSGVRMVQQRTAQQQPQQQQQQQQQQVNLNGGQNVQLQQQQQQQQQQQPEPQMSASYVQHQSYCYSPVQRWLPLGSYPASQLISSSWFTQNQVMMNNYHQQVSSKPQWNSFEIKDIFNRRDILRSYFLDDAGAAADKDPSVASQVAAAAGTASFAGLEIETGSAAACTAAGRAAATSAASATEGGAFKEHHQVSASISEELEIQALEQYSNSNENFYQELERQATEQYRNSPE